MQRNLWKRMAFMVAGFGLMALVSHRAMADDAPLTVESLSATITTAVDSLWVMIAAFLVFFMQAGFAYVEGGMTRAKNQNNILMKNLLDFCIGTIAFYMVGFAFMFGDGNSFIGTSGFFLGGADNSPAIGEAYKGVYGAINWTGVPLMAKFMFQLVFAATAATIVSGAMAERTKFSAYLLYSVFISAIIYPVVGHWIWGGGWLASKGFFDFAGSTVVHSTGGWVALVGAILLGPRIGKFNKDGSANAIPGHNIPMAGLGVFILWLGWFGFNPGSTMSAVGSRDAIAHIAATTNMAAAGGAILAMMTSWFMFKKPDVSMSLNGALAGLVAITCACAWVSVPSAAAIGCIAGVLVVFSVLFFEKLRIDDPVGAVSVHGVCGAFGTLSLGIFSQGDAFGSAGPEKGLLFGGGMTQLINQAIGVFSVMAWCVVTGLVLFLAIKAVNGLRVSPEEEYAGLDIGEHGSEAYSFAPGQMQGTPHPHAPEEAPSRAIPLGKPVTE